MKRNLWALGGAAVLTLLFGGCQPTDGDNMENAPGKNGAASSAENPSDLGAAALDSGDWTRAVDAFSDAIAADAKNVDAYFGRAAASTAIAKDHYRLAKAAATNEDTETGRKEAAKADEYFQKSLDDCAKILEIDPKFAEAYFLRGVAAQYQANWEPGIEAFTKCVELDPTRAEAFHRRGEIYAHIGDYMNAEVDFKKAAELGYKDADSDDVSAETAE